jgi:hypothetical protein
VRSPSRRSVVRHDFADHSGGIETGEPRKIHRGFRLSRAHEYAAFPRSQWKSVPGAQKVGRLYVGIEQSLDRGRAIVGRDARRRHPARFDRNGKRGFVNGRVVANHLRDVKLVEASADHRHADQTAGVLAHKVDRGRRRQLSRHHEVAFVLPVLVVEHHHHLAGADVPDGLLDGVEGAVTLG